MKVSNIVALSNKNKHLPKEELATVTDNFIGDAYLHMNIYTNICQQNNTTQGRLT